MSTCIKALVLLVMVSLSACGGGDKPLDTDLDGIPNTSDLDDDNDGVNDTDDAFPLDSKENLDSDGDGIGNNADLDDDNDGVNDTDDAFPLDSKENLDSDGDGIGNNTDMDDDNDEILDRYDNKPLNPYNNNIIETSEKLNSSLGLASRAYFSDGSSVVSRGQSDFEDGKWQSYIYAQLVDSYGEVTKSFQVATSPGYQHFFDSIRVEVIDDSKFVVVWRIISETQGMQSSINGQVFDAQGVPIYSKFSINVFKESFYHGYGTLNGKEFYGWSSFDVTTLSGGEVVIVFSDREPDGGEHEPGGAAIYKVIYGANGVLGPKVMVINKDDSDWFSSSYFYTMPDISSLNNGGYIITWNYSDGRSGAACPSRYVISFQAQVFDYQGIPNSQVFRFGGICSQLQAKLIRLSGGEHVAIYRRDANASSLYMHLFDSNGLAKDSPQKIYSGQGPRSDNHHWAFGLSDGGFVVFWGRSINSHISTNYTSIQGQRFKANGDKVGEPFVVSSDVTQFSDLAIGNTHNNGFTVYWSDLNGVFFKTYNYFPLD